MKSSYFVLAMILAAGVSAHATPPANPVVPAAPRIQIVADQTFSGKMSTGAMLKLSIQADGSVLKSMVPSIVPANAAQTLTIRSVVDNRGGDGDLVITFDSGEKLEQASRGISGIGDTGVYFMNLSGEQVPLIPAVTILAH